MRTVVIVLSAAALSACGQSGDSAAVSKATANAAQPKKKPAYCFFEDEEMKGWSAARGKDGNLVVKGKAHVGDSRYTAVLGPPAVTGSSAQISLTIAPNTGYQSPGDWWDLNATIPNSAVVGSVNVTCGDKTVAKLSVPPHG